MWPNLASILSLSLCNLTSKSSYKEYFKNNLPVTGSIVLTQLAGSIPSDMLKDGFPLAGAFVLALPEDEQIGLKEYELVASFVPALD